MNKFQVRAVDVEITVDKWSRESDGRSNSVLSPLSSAHIHRDESYNDVVEHAHPGGRHL